MRNKVILLAISALLLILPALGCMTDDSKAPATSAAFVSAAQHAADVAALNASLAKKADQTSVDMLVKMMPAGGATATDTYPKTQLYTKDEVNAAITAAITALKAEKPWGNTVNPGGSTTTPSGDTIISTNGDLDLILERAPGDEEVWVNNNIPVEWRLTVKNRSNSGTYFRMNANFDTTDTPTTITTATLVPSYSQSAMMFTPDISSPSVAISNMAFSSQVSASNAKVWIPKNSSQSLYLILKIVYADPNVAGKRWTWDFNIRQLN